MDAVALLLAAGRSVRLGRDKTALEIQGETLVQRHLRQLRGVGVAEALVVCNESNEAEIGRRTGARTILQNGEGMSAAVRTGLAALPGAGSVWIVCVNDILDDAGYSGVARAAGEGIAIPTCVLARNFPGGHLLLEGDRVRAIVEKPRGGCPAGAHANIMVHLVSGPAARGALATAADYEDAVNALIAGGLPVRAVPVDFWMAVKTPEDLDILNRSLGAAL